MSSIKWEGNTLIQSLRNNTEELGHLKHDEETDAYVLMLKDTRDVFNTGKGYIAADTFKSSAENAKFHALSATTVQLFHMMWLVGLQKGMK